MWRLGSFNNAKFCLEELLVMNPNSYQNHCRYAEVRAAGRGRGSGLVVSRLLTQACSVFRALCTCV